MKKADGEREGGDDDTLHLTRHERVRDDDRGDDHLNDGKLGDGRHRETILNVLGLGGGGGGIHFSALAVSGHVYYLLRK